MTTDFCMTLPVTDNVDVDTIGNCGGAGLDIKPEEKGDYFGQSYNQSQR